MNIDELYVAFFVPINEAGEKEMEYLDYIDNQSPNIKEFNMKSKLNNLLTPLYNQFNQAFGIIIDNCEDERMKKEDVPKALEMAWQFKKETVDTNTDIAATNLIEVLTFAKEHNSMVEFWF